MPVLDESWKLEGLCAEVDPELFFPEPGDSAAARRAKWICGRCGVREQCLDWALRRPEHYGIWGALTGNERDQLRSQGLTSPPSSN